MNLLIQARDKNDFALRQQQIAFIIETKLDITAWSLEFQASLSEAVRTNIFTGIIIYDSDRIAPNSGFIFIGFVEVVGIDDLDERAFSFEIEQIKCRGDPKPGDIAGHFDAVENSLSK